ncbi:Uncharacterised protein [Yersinia frederiksenii]|jgi:hypothetical protein|uniref:Uncharacterized protein n=1 Tax=Yersinia frederiksenii TaxID=29484 RepID=A0AAI9EQC8_YERFR|nr:Uncharacterised protein [Yersinia frederiksenii]CFR26735.1 Uncharacterised protein [Yersinia frederiksenii]CNG37503.1 Uncharacterised protein [Yersinia frederiksenii]CNL65778.1 Uncharacterised protein [Yersinia frederiksenii]CQH26321.1 Uncharacterised protein [Yersinia frederiksenii]
MLTGSHLLAGGRRGGEDDAVSGCDSICQRNVLVSVITCLQLNIFATLPHPPH